MTRLETYAPELDRGDFRSGAAADYRVPLLSCNPDTGTARNAGTGNVGVSAAAIGAATTDAVAPAAATRTTTALVLEDLGISVHLPLLNGWAVRSAAESFSRRTTSR